MAGLKTSKTCTCLKPSENSEVIFLNQNVYINIVTKIISIDAMKNTDIIFLDLQIYFE
jgi:hypothetical protein